MTAAAVLEILRLVAELTPPALELANSLVKAAGAGEISMDDIRALRAQLKPMELKPE